MIEGIERFIREVRDLYKDIIINNPSHIKRGKALWDQFEAAARVCCADEKADSRQLTERVNELAVAKALIEDTSIMGPIFYEPEILPDHRKIDFVATKGDENIYIEVKTVHPQTADTDEAWNNYLRRRKHHPENVRFHVEQEWMGGELYGNAFASRSHFLDYTLEFESRLAVAKTIRKGLGVLIFCGNGFAWDCSNLEDFVDFYHSGTHRQDDSFALMEDHYIADEGIQLLHNVDHFAYLKRAITQPLMKQFVFPVRGPNFGRPIIKA